MSLEEQFKLQISDEHAEKITTVGEAVESRPSRRQLTPS